MKTVTTKASDIHRVWHKVDLHGQTLGRVASEIAQLLMGKSKPYFVRNLDCGDYVVVVNAKDVQVTGTKELHKIYYRHSGYPGGFKAERFEELVERKPEDVITHAVKGMLPQNKLRDAMLTRLIVLKQDDHSFDKKFATK